MAATKLRAVLVAFGSLGDDSVPSRATDPRTAREARGFSADMVILLRKPKSSSDEKDLTVFKECLSNSTFRILTVAETL
jgi:hypothetical protein